VRPARAACSPGADPPTTPWTVEQNRSRLSWAVSDVIADIVRPPPPAGVPDSGLHDALAVTPPWRAGLDNRPVVLGDRGEARLDVAGARYDDRRQPVGAPDAGRPAETADDPVHRFDEVRLVRAIAEHAAEVTGVRQRAEEHVGRPAPRRPAVEPVPLCLVSKPVLDLDRLPAAHARTGLAVRPEPGQAHRPGQEALRSRSDHARLPDTSASGTSAQMVNLPDEVSACAVTHLVRARSGVQNPSPQVTAGFRCLVSSLGGGRRPLLRPRRPHRGHIGPV
jgi:hypothetical protein